MIPRSGRKTGALAALALAAGALLGACDPPPAEDLVLGPAPARAFAVERVTPDRAALAADDALVVRFTSDLDTGRLGSRSVRVTRSDGRRPVRIRTRVSGRELYVAGLPGRGFPVGETLLLHVDGAPSPRALRSAAGEPLPARYEATFRTGERRTDLSGPELLGSSPRDGATGVAPGSSIELRFDEPLARGSVGSGECVTLRVDGVASPARLELSGDASVVVVRPASPIAPDRSVEVEIRDCLLDAAGNPLARGPRVVRFRTSSNSLHVLAEDFVDAANADLAATSCGWDDAEAPGALVAKGGVLRVSSHPGAPTRAIRDVESLHFQLLVAADDVPAGLASGLRVEFAQAPAGARVTAAVVEAGPALVSVREASFLANRAAADLRPVARADDGVEIEAPSPGESPAAEIVFDSPLRLQRGQAILLDVRLDVTRGVVFAAHDDDDAVEALVEGRAGVAPAVALLVTPSTPQARSLWYDTGVRYPGWRTASVEFTNDAPGTPAVTEYQTAPATRDGSPDAGRASPWGADLTRLPAYRFVRFRVRFDALATGPAAPRIDRIVLPYER